MGAVLEAVSPALEELFAILEGGGGLAGIGVRGALGAIVGFAVGDIISFLKGRPSAKKHVPQFALVDLHNDKVLTFVSRRRAYRFLLRPRRRGRTRTIIREIQRPSNVTEIVR